jgi:hypothetical protein
MNERIQMLLHFQFYLEYNGELEANVRVEFATD